MDNMGNNYKDLVRMLREIDFALVDVCLYLDMYPTCRKALEYQRKLAEKRKEVCGMYERRYGPLSNQVPNNGMWLSYNNMPWAGEPERIGDGE